MILRDAGEFCGFSCDECGDSIVQTGMTFGQGVAAIRAEHGWRVVADGSGGWTHVCDGCTPGEPTRSGDRLAAARRMFGK